MLAQDVIQNCLNQTELQTEMYCQLIKQTSKYRGQPVPEGSAVRFVNIIFFPSGFIFDVSWIKFYSQLSFGLSSSGAHSKKSSFASFHLFSVKQLAHDRSGKQMCNLMLMGKLYLNHLPHLSK